MRRFGETYWQLYRAVVHLNETFDNKTLLSWIQGERVPRSVASFNILRRIERRYRLAEGYFKEKLPHQARSLYGHDLPHGPHNLRDILATHILKQTGSYEQASYAIQDTPDVVQQHYGRFLPQDKAALAAKILNQVWEAA